MGTMIDAGLSALTSYQRAMEVTSNNIANSATPGYSRQRVELTTREGFISPIGVQGRGVTIDSVTRVSDQLITERLRQVFGDEGRLDTLNRALADTELVFNEPGEAGLSATIDRLFATLEDLGNNPESSALRTGAVQQLRTVATMFNTIGDQLQNQFDDLRISAEDEVREVNDLINQVAEINQEIRRFTIGGNDPNQLLDRREELLRQLTQRIGIGVIYQGDGSVRVELEGRLLIGADQGRQLALTTTQDNSIGVVFADNGESTSIPGGNLAGLVEMGTDILPELIDDFNELAGGLIRNFNAAHATGTNHIAINPNFVAETTVRADLASVNLDDASQVTGESTNGIAQVLLPDFTDANGNLTNTNLAINVLNTATGVADKFIVRYEPGTEIGGASRTLEDLAAAINSGIGGGFTVEPPHLGGVNGVTATLVSVEGGRRLTLDAGNGFSIDFSPAMDQRPADTAWTGSDLTIDGTSTVAGLENTRLVFRYDLANDEFDAYTLDAITGLESAFGSFANNPGGSTTVNGITLTFAAGATYTDGETTAVDLDASLAVNGGPVTRNNEWTSGNAGFLIDGRYTGTHSYDPSRQWTMRVVQGGTIGAANGAPVVEFTYYTGPDDARVLETSQIQLDDAIPPGAQVEIGEGLFAVFDAGSLTAGDQVGMVVEGQPDQAGLLTALGINTLFSGSDARTMAVTERISDEPDLFSVARTRSAGDNSNLLIMRDVREQPTFGSVGVGLDDFYQSMVSDVAVRIGQAEALLDNQGVIRESLENRRDEVSGVNVDEEVGQLILQQQAYQAAARVITFARENIQTLLEVIR